MSSVLSLIREAGNAVAEKKLEKAMTLYFSILEREPENTRAIIGLGIISAMAGNHSDANELCKKAQNTDDGRNEYWATRSIKKLKRHYR